MRRGWQQLWSPGRSRRRGRRAGRHIGRQIGVRLVCGLGAGFRTFGHIPIPDPSGGGAVGQAAGSRGAVGTGTVVRVIERVKVAGQVRVARPSKSTKTGLTQPTPLPIWVPNSGCCCANSNGCTKYTIRCAWGAKDSSRFELQPEFRVRHPGRCVQDGWVRQFLTCV